MQAQDQVPGKTKSYTMWFIVGAIILACCCVSVIAILFAGPIISNTFNSQNSSPFGGDFSSTASPSNSSSDGPVSGGLGDPTLKDDVWNSVTDFYATNRNCTDVTNTNIEVTQPTDSDGVWEEAWTFVACGSTDVLNVKFTPSLQGGTDFHISQ